MDMNTFLLWIFVQRLYDAQWRIGVLKQKHFRTTLVYVTTKHH